MSSEPSGSSRPSFSGVPRLILLYGDGGVHSLLRFLRALPEPTRFSLTILTASGVCYRDLLENHAGQAPDIGMVRVEGPVAEKPATALLVPPSSVLGRQEDCWTPVQMGVPPRSALNATLSALSDWTGPVTCVVFAGTVMAGAEGLKALLHTDARLLVERVDAGPAAELPTMALKLAPGSFSGSPEELAVLAHRGESTGGVSEEVHSCGNTLPEAVVTPDPAVAPSSERSGSPGTAATIPPPGETNEDTLFRIIADASPDVYWVSDPSMRSYCFVSKSFGRIWGVKVGSPDEAATVWRESLHPEDRRRVLDHWGDRVPQPRDIMYRIIRSDGCIRWIRDQCFPQVDDQKRQVRVAGIASDITERRHTEERLRENEERLALMFEGIDGGGWDWDIEHGDLIINQNMMRLTRDEGGDRRMTMSAFMARIHPDDQALFDRAVTDHLAGKTPLIEVEHRLLASGNRWRWVLNRGKIVERDQLGRPRRVTGCAIDIEARKNADEERRRLEAELGRLQKLESLRSLAGGVAHEFNNLLTVINGCSEMIQMEVAADSPIYRNADEILLASARMGRLAGQMLSYSGQGRYLLERIHLGQLVTSMEERLSTSLPETTRLVLKPEKASEEVEGDAAQLRQIIVDLVTNSSEAIVGREGTIEVRTWSDDLSSEALDQAVLNELGTAKRGVFLEVKDNGCGIAEEVMGRIFDPFYTTKFAGRGLGLAAVLGVVRAHRGAILVESRVDEGTRVLVAFPAKAARHSQEMAK